MTNIDRFSSISNAAHKRLSKADLQSLEIYKNKLGSFLDRMRDLGMNEMTCRKECKLVRRCLVLLNEDRHSPIELSAISTGDLASLRERMSDLSENTKSQYLLVFGRFICFCVGNCPEIAGINPRRRNAFPWYAGHLGNFDFQDKLDAHLESLRRDGLSGRSVDNRRTAIILCCRILDAEAGICSLEEIASTHIALITRLMQGVTERTVQQYLSWFGSFIEESTGRNPWKEWRRDLRHESPRIPDTPQGRSFIEDLAGFLEDMKLRRRKRTTLLNKSNGVTAVFAMIQEIFGDTYAYDVTPAMFAELLNHRTGIKENSMKTYMRDFSFFCRYLYGNDLMKDSGIVWPSVNIDRKFLTLDEWNEIKNVADPDELLILHFGAMMGLRRSEIASIKLVDIDKGILTIHGKGHGDGGLIAKAPIPKTLQNEIFDYLVRRQSIFDEHGDRSRGYLIVRSYQKAGMPITPSIVEDAIARVSKKSGVDFTSHALRRLYCMTMLDAGHSVYEVSKMMRHSSMSTTYQCYIDVDSRKKASIENEVDSILA